METDQVFFVSPTATVADEFDMTHDAQWAQLASAYGAEAEESDHDCESMVAAIDNIAFELGRTVSSKLLGAKSKLARQAQARQAATLATAAAEQRRLLALLDEEIEARRILQAQFEKSQQIQTRMADALAQTRTAGQTRLQASAVMADWTRMLADQKREAYCERAAGKFDRKRLLRKCVCRWRTASRKLRHLRIDSFWENACAELREALQGHYEPRLAELESKLDAAHNDAADAWRAKEDLGKQLKAAFMRGVCQLNLETATILEQGENDQEENHLPRGAPPPKPMQPQELLAAAKKGLQLQMTRR